MAEGKWVSYLRVSTGRQGQSGLGIEAQRKAVEDFLNGGSWELAKEYVEVESGTQIAQLLPNALSGDRLGEGRRPSTHHRRAARGRRNVTAGSCSRIERARYSYGTRWRMECNAGYARVGTAVGPQWRFRSCANGRAGTVGPSFEQLRHFSISQKYLLT